MFTVCKSFIAVFLLLMIAQVGHACPSTYLYESSDAEVLNTYADASVSDPGANSVGVLVAIFKPSGDGGSDYGSGDTAAEAHASAALNEDGDWYSRADYISDAHAISPRTFPFKFGKQQVSFVWNSIYENCVYESQCVPPPPNYSFCGPYTYTKPFRAPLIPNCYNFNAQRYRFFKQSAIGTTLTCFQTEVDIESQTNIPCDAAIP